MPILYDDKTDVLTLVLAPECGDTCELEASDFSVVVDEAGSLASIAIGHASRFVAQALAAGVRVEGAPAVEPPAKGMVWYGAESSMISAFGYDESEGILAVAFHRTGVYRYYDVPVHVFEGLRDASSKGRYLRGHVMDIYPWEKSRGPLRRE